MRTPAPLAGRYKFARSIQAGTNTLAWLATDERFGKQVVACALGEVRLRALERSVGVEHTYLATVLDMVRDPPAEALPEEGVRASAVAIAEYVPGLTLYEQLKEGALPASDAVTMIARAAEGVQALHAAGAVHGSISPRTLVIAPSAARPAPVLAQLVAPTSGAYSTPERLEGGGPTPENDVWALYAMLYAALSGVPAFEGASKEELSRNMREQKRRTLAELSVDRPELEALIAEGLAGSAEKRRSNLGELLNGLTAWTKNRDALTAEAAELARLSMDWEDEELPGAPASAPAAAAPTPPPSTPVAIDYPMFSDEDADVATTVFRPGQILEAAAALLHDPPPPEPRFHRPRQLSIFIPEPPLEPATPAALLTDAPARPASTEAPVSVNPTPVVPSKPPPLPSSSKLPAATVSTKPRHPNKRRAMEEKALEELRSEAAPLGNEEQPVIPMFPLEALYDEERARVRDSLAAEEKQDPESGSSPDAAGSPTPDATKETRASSALSRRDTGMVSRAPPKPAEQSKKERASRMARKAAQREVAISSRPEPRRDSKPWHDLTVPSKARRAERAAAEAARVVAPRPKQASPWLWIVGVLGGLTAVAITALELERRGGSGKPAAPPDDTHEQKANAPPGASEWMAPIWPPATDAESSGNPDATTAAEAAATNPLGVCAASYFPAGTFTGAEDFAFLCGDADFRGVTSQLHRQLVVAGAGNVSEGMREWATLGWYELGVAAVVRVRCCPDAGPINLPSYSSDACKPMPAALAAVAREPMSPSDVPDRAGALATDIRCLYLNGIPRPYHYGVQPSGANRLTFEAFLTRIAARPH